MRPSLSVVIPTRNRETELQSLLRLIGRVNSQLIEFVVSDNSDSPFEDKDPKLAVSWVRPSRVLNMTEHWNFAISKASGRYLTFVGDDDAFIPGNLEKLALYLESCRDDFVTTDPAGFEWPSDNGDGSFQFISRSGTEPLPQLRRDLTRLRRLSRLPVPYNRVAFSERLLERFQSRAPGRQFFSSRIPDVNAAAKIAMLAQSSSFFRELVFISGASPTSNGLLSRMQPGHPRAREFDNLTFNPLGSASLWLSDTPSPFGFMTFYEAVNDALVSLEIVHRRSQGYLALRSVVESSNPRAQAAISARIWPRSTLQILLGSLISRVFERKIWRMARTLLSKGVLLFWILLGRLRLVRISGQSLNTTENLIDALETLQVLSTKRRLLRIEV